MTIKRVTEMENILRELPPAEMPVTHHFSKGVYARELFIPAGTILTGEIHKYQSLNILLSGQIAVLTNDGIKKPESGFVEVSSPGMKRIAFAITDTRWLTVHGTDETDVEKIKDEFIAANEQEFIEFCEAQMLLKGE